MKKEWKNVIFDAVLLWGWLGIAVIWSLYKIKIIEFGLLACFTIWFLVLDFLFHGKRKITPNYLIIWFMLVQLLALTILLSFMNSSGLEVLLATLLIWLAISPWLLFHILKYEFREREQKIPENGQTNQVS